MIDDAVGRQAILPFITVATGEREALVVRWTTLVRETLPAMAQRCRWPILHDHCFMRVCLDTALGGPWHSFVKRPAIRHLTDAQLAAAIAVAEGLVQAPKSLDALNQQSISWRQSLGVS
jgi:hypothetical protein